MAENGNSRVHFSIHIFPDEFTYSLDTSLAFKGLKKWDGEVPGPLEVGGSSNFLAWSSRHRREVTWSLYIQYIEYVLGLAVHPKDNIY